MKLFLISTLLLDLQGDWGTTALEEGENQRRKMEFQRSFLPSSKAQLKVLAQSYQVWVNPF